MPGHSIKRIDDMEAIYLGGFKRARAELGVSSFGLAVIDLPPNFDAYPEHDHSSDGQEEVYVTLRGGGEIEIDGERHPMDPDTMVMVGSGVRRKIFPGDEGTARDGRSAACPAAPTSRRTSPSSASPTPPPSSASG